MQNLTSILIDASLESLAVLLLAMLITLAMRRSSAAARHLVWTGAIVSVLALPAMAYLLPGLAVMPAVAVQTAPLSAPSAEEATPTPSPPPAATPQPRASVPPAAHNDAAATAPAAEPPVANVSVATSADEATPSATAQRLAWLPWIWLSGTLFALLPLALGHLSLLRLRRMARAVTEGPWHALHMQLRDELRIRRPVTLLRSPCRTMPMTWGALPRVPAKVLLPEEADTWSADRRRAVLMHELAHVKRRDGLTQLLAHIACALYWPNPLVWLAAHRMFIERERACDDTVLLHDTKSSDYAEHLLDIATGPQATFFAAHAGIAMARRSNLDGRLVAILDQQRNRRAMTRLGVAITVTLLGAVVVPLAMLQAQERGQRVTAAFYYQVFEVPADVAGELLPEDQREAVDDSVYSLVRLTSDEVRQLVENVQTDTGKLHNKRRSISGWPKVADSWAYSRADGELLGGGTGGGFLGVRGHQREREIRIDYNIKHRISTSEPINSKIVHEGPLPEDHAIAFLAPFEREDGTNLYHVILFEFPDPQAGEAEADDAGESSSAPDAFVARLPNGVTVELTGLAPHPSAEEQWWRPDGSELKRAPVAITRNRYSDATGRVLEMAVRVRGFENADLVVRREGGGISTLHNQRDGQLWVNAFRPGRDGPSNLRSTDISLRFAWGDWETLASAGPEQSAESAGDDRFIFAPAVEHEEGVTRTVSHNVRVHDRDYRIVAVLRNGDMVSVGASSRTLDELTQSTVNFRGLSLDQIREFQFQTRPWRRVTFRNVSLQPGHETEVEVEVHQADASDQADRNNRAGMVRVQGEVPRPGAYSIPDDGLTLVQLLMSAGNTLNHPDPHAVPIRVIYETADGRRALRYGGTLGALIAGEGVNPSLRDGDIVIVGDAEGQAELERQPSPAANGAGRVYVGGEVTRPGAYVLPGDDLALRTFLISVGLVDEERADSLFADVLRQAPDGRLQRATRVPLAALLAGDGANPTLRAGDLVLVREPEDARQKPADAPADAASERVIEDLKERVEAETHRVERQERLQEIGRASLADVAAAREDQLNARLRLAEARGEEEDATEALKEIVRIREQALRLTRTLVELGRAAPSDVAQAETELRKARDRLVIKRADRDDLEEAGNVRNDAAATGLAQVATAAEDFWEAIGAGDDERALALSVPGQFPAGAFARLRENAELSEAGVAQVHAGKAAAITITEAIMPVERRRGSARIGISLIRQGDRWVVRDMDILPSEQAVEEFIQAFRERFPGAADVPASHRETDNPELQRPEGEAPAVPSPREEAPAAEDERDT